MYFILGIIVGILIAIISIAVGVLLSKQTRFRQLVNKAEQLSRAKGKIYDKETDTEKARKAINNFVNK